MCHISSQSETASDWIDSQKKVINTKMLLFFKMMFLIVYILRFPHSKIKDERLKLSYNIICFLDMYWNVLKLSSNIMILY